MITSKEKCYFKYRTANDTDISSNFHISYIEQHILLNVHLHYISEVEKTQC